MLAEPTGLSDANDIMTFNDCWDGITLDRSGNFVTGELNVAPHGWMESTAIKAIDWGDTCGTFLDELDTRDSTEELRAFSWNFGRYPEWSWRHLL